MSEDVKAQPERQRQQPRGMIFIDYYWLLRLTATKYIRDDELEMRRRDDSHSGVIEYSFAMQC